jgi:methylated-DNA-[protein]-cysteine S-methyltransferase
LTGFATLQTPFGRLSIEATDTHITALHWKTGRGEVETPLLAEAVRQLEAYFERRLTRFDLPLAPKGSPFEQQVFAAMQAIPFGETRTYGEIAKALDAMPQPVGQACGANPIPVIIPCHRITASDGLGGFSAPGGVETKVALLKHEGAYSLLL